jgi:hypothetical protein
MRTATSPMRIHQWSRRGRAGGGGVIRGMLSRPLNAAGPAPFFGTGPFDVRCVRCSAYGTLTEVLSPELVMVKVPDAVEV